MAENNVIISAEEEAKLLKPIDEYVGKIQKQIDALRVEGSDKVNSLKNQIAIAKENKNLTKEQQNKIIEESKKQLEKATATEAANKDQITVNIMTLLPRVVKLRRKQRTAALKKLKHSFRKSIRKHLEA